MITETQFQTFAAYLAQLGTDQAYRVAHDCDAVFRRELVRVYGRRVACQARYWPSHKYIDAQLMRAEARKLEADRHLMNLLRGRRTAAMLAQVHA